MQLNRKTVMGRSALLLTIFALTYPALAADWTQWRGPTRTGESEGPAWPSSLENLETVWSKPLGKGYPGPIISGDRVFVVESTASEDASVRALSRKTGESIWQARWDSGADVPFFARANGDWVRSTPGF